MTTTKPTYAVTKIAQLLRDTAQELRETATVAPLHEWEDGKEMAARELHDESLEAAEIAEALIAENESLRAGYDAARLEIASLQAQMEAVGAGGVSALMAAPAQPVAVTLTKWAERLDPVQTDWDAGYEAARAYVKMQLDCGPAQPVAVVTSKLGDICSFRSSVARKGDAVYLQPPTQAQEEAKIYRRGYRDGYDQRDAELKGAFA